MPISPSGWSADTLPGVNLQPFIAGLPKAELHVHHVGSASPRIVSELAARHPDAGVPSDLDDLRQFFTFRDFAHFIDVYLAVVDLVRTPEDVRLLTYEVAREMAQGQQVRYAELTCTPHTSVLAGVPIEAYTEAIEDARVGAERDFGIVLRWIYDIPGELGVPGVGEPVVLPRRTGVAAREVGLEQACGLEPGEAGVDGPLGQVVEAGATELGDDPVAVLVAGRQQAQQEESEDSLEHLRVVGGHGSSLDPVPVYVKYLRMSRPAGRGRFRPCASQSPAPSRQTTS